MADNGSSPVVPSVGAVPVEVPEDALRAGACALANVVRLPDWLQVRALGHDMRPLAQLALAAAYPLIAARVRAEAVADERQRMASFLVELLTGIVPADTIRWDAAVEMLGAELRANRDHDAQVRAEERRRVLAVMEQPAFMQAAMDRAQLTCFTDDDGQDIGIMPGSHAAVAKARMQDEFGRTPRPWTSVANYPGKAWRPCCENWRAETRKVFGPVLAALREVAGL